MELQVLKKWLTGKRKKKRNLSEEEELTSEEEKSKTKIPAKVAICPSCKSKKVQSKTRNTLSREFCATKSASSE